MPKGKKRSVQGGYTGAQAQVILDRLMKRGVVTKAHLNAVDKELDAERQSLLAQLEALGGLKGMAIAAVGGAAAGAGIVKAARAARTQAPMTPERLAKSQLQGKYLSLMKKIPKDVVTKQFSKDAIGSQGKEAVVAAMEAYIAKHGEAGGGSKKGSKK